MAEFHPIHEAIEDIKNGKMIIVIDDEDRENEGDFIMAGEKVTPESINFMATEGRGLICTPITQKRANELHLPPMYKGNESYHETAFTVSIDGAKAGTGISAEDRAITTLALVEKETSPSDLLRPGHTFPLVAKDGGVLERDGHTEAAVDLCRLAGLAPVGVICEICNPDGSMARTDDLLAMAKRLDMKIITIKDLVLYRKNHEAWITKISETLLPTEYGDFQLKIFESNYSNEYHMAFVYGDEEEIKKEDSALVRIHSECLTGDIFGSKRCDCGDQLKTSMKKIKERGKGVVVYLRQEGRGIGLPNKVKAYALQDKGLDTISANHALGFKGDLRDYSFAAQMIKSLGIKKVDLLTNNPEKVGGLQKFGIEVNRSSLEIEHNEVNINYLKTKRDKMGHSILSKIH